MYRDFFGFMAAQDLRGSDEYAVLVSSRMPRNEQVAQLAVQDGFRLAGSFGSPPMIPLSLTHSGAHRLTRFQVE